MSSKLPDGLGAEFWTALFLIAVFSLGCYAGYRFDNWYGVSISGLFLALNIYRLVYHLKRVRLSQALKKHPELKRLYDMRNP